MMSGDGFGWWLLFVVGCVIALGELCFGRRGRR